MSDYADNADNTALIADARAWAKDAAHIGRSIVRDVDSGILFARRLSDALEAVLAAAGVAPQPEPEYEYTWAGTDDEGDDWIMDDWFATVGGAEPGRMALPARGFRAWAVRHRMDAASGADFGMKEVTEEGLKDMKEKDPRVVAVCPECVAGKHGNCDKTAFDAKNDQIVACECRATEHKKVAA